MTTFKVFRVGFLVVSLAIVIGISSCGSHVTEKRHSAEIKASYNKGYSAGRSFIKKELKKTKVKPVVVVDPSTLELTVHEILFVKELYAENLVLQGK